MTMIHPVPPYLSKIAEYAVDNMTKNGFEMSDCIYTSVKINVYERQVVFRQRVTKKKEKHEIDCWEIFPLAKAILDDPFRQFTKLKVVVSFKDGKISRTDYSIYKDNDE